MKDKIKESIFNKISDLESKIKTEKDEFALYEENYKNSIELDMPNPYEIVDTRLEIEPKVYENSFIGELQQQYDETRDISKKRQILEKIKNIKEMELSQKRKELELRIGNYEKEIISVKENGIVEIRDGIKKDTERMKEIDEIVLKIRKEIEEQRENIEINNQFLKLKKDKKAKAYRTVEKETESEERSIGYKIGKIDKLIKERKRLKKIILDRKEFLIELGDKKEIEEQNQQKLDLENERKRQEQAKARINAKLEQIKMKKKEELNQNLEKTEQIQKIDGGKESESAEPIQRVSEEREPESAESIQEVSEEKEPKSAESIQKVSEEKEPKNIEPIQKHSKKITRIRFVAKDLTYIVTFDDDESIPYTIKEDEYKFNPKYNVKERILHQEKIGDNDLRILLEQVDAENGTNGLETYIHSLRESNNDVKIYGEDVFHLIYDCEGIEKSNIDKDIVKDIKSKAKIAKRQGVGDYYKTEGLLDRILKRFGKWLGKVEKLPWHKGDTERFGREDSDDTYNQTKLKTYKERRKDLIHELDERDNIDQTRPLQIDSNLKETKQRTR